MNKIESKFNFKTFLMFLTVLVLSLSMVFATACKNGGESTSTSESDSTTSTSSASESEEAQDDTQLFANGDFEHPTNKYPSSTPITLSSSSNKWSGSVDGDVGFQINSSSVKRGIIDVSETYFNKLGTDYKEATNPQTPVLAGKMTNDENSDAKEDGTRILMLRNKEYAAQYVTSATTLTVPAGSYGKLTVWVRTSELESYSDAGAYIKVKNNVSNPNDEGTTYNPLVIENINTNAEWVEYTIYVAPNLNKASSFTLILGLGEGNSLYVENHVKGYAYFDNISFELIGADAYTGATVDKSVKVVDYTGAEDDGRISGVHSVKFDLTETDTSSWNLGGEIADLTYAHTPDVVSSNHVTLADNVLTIDFSSLAIGAAYTHTSAVHELAGGEYVRISFWAKIEAKSYQTKATIALYDTLQGKDVATFDNVSTDGHEDEIREDFARYTFYVANNFFYDEDTTDGVVDFEETMQYQLKISFGPTDANSISDVKLLPTGTATFKDFEIETLTKENYDLANTTTDTRAKKASLIGTYASDYVAPEDEEEEDDETSDSYNVTVSGFGKTLLENGEIVSLDELTSSNLVQSKQDDNNVAVIGVVNSKYASQYSSEVKAALDAVQAKDKGSNEYVQALLVHNVKGNNLVSGNVVSVSKNSTYVFSIRVYAHGDARAFVKLFVVENSTSGDKLPEPEYRTVITQPVSDKFNNGFATVTFIITTGFEDFDVRLQFGVENENQVALFQSIVTGTVNTTYTSADAVKTAFADDYVFSGDVKSTVKTYHYSSEDHVGDLSLALTDEDTGAVLCDESKTKEIQSTYATVKESSVKLVIYNRFDLNDRYVIDLPETEESASESVEESTSDENAEGGQNYGWLQVTSIIIALVLVIALIAVVVRKAAEGKNKKKKNTERYYQGYDKSKKYTKDDVAIPDDDDKAKDYDYDNPENN